MYNYIKKEIARFLINQLKMLKSMTYIGQVKIKFNKLIII